MTVYSLRGYIFVNHSTYKKRRSVAAHMQSHIFVGQEQYAIACWYIELDL